MSTNIWDGYSLRLVNVKHPTTGRFENAWELTSGSKQVMNPDREDGFFDSDWAANRFYRKMKGLKRKVFGTEKE